MRIRERFNPRALAGRDVVARSLARALFRISTHAPLAGRDDSNRLTGGENSYISTHAPLAGRDSTACSSFALDFTFQPTRPLRGATLPEAADAVPDQHFNPRAPCGARPSSTAITSLTIMYFNPRAPCGARRVYVLSGDMPYVISTHAPLAGRDRNGDPVAWTTKISTHAPLAGRDLTTRRVGVLFRKDFNPRAPCGARQGLCPCGDGGSGISTHAPLAGRDVLVFITTVTWIKFQPTRPLRGATEDKPK